MTLIHEHVLIDGTLYWAPASEDDAEDPDRPVSLEILWRLRRNTAGVTRDNLVLDDAELAVQELAAFRRSGGSTIVDLTPRGTGRRFDEVARIAGAAELNVVFGSGFYTEPTLTPEILAASAEQIADILIRDVTTGIDGSEIKAGMIGEIGTSDPIGPGEETVLRGAAIAQRETGVALNVHLQELGGNGLQILDRIDEAGGDLSRVVLSHLDSRMDLTYHEALARRGAYVEYDCFGIEEYREREACWSPTDRERVEGVCRLVERGYGRQILLSTDVCMKTQLLRYGGPGYAHVPDNVVPMLLRAGLDQATVDVLMRENPARVLALEP